MGKVGQVFGFELNSDSSSHFLHTLRYYKSTEYRSLSNLAKATPTVLLRESRLKLVGPLFMNMLVG